LRPPRYGAKRAHRGWIDLVEADAELRYHFQARQRAQHALVDRLERHERGVAPVETRDRFLFGAVVRHAPVFTFASG